MGKKLTNKVLLIGWDAADWKVIEPLMKQGKMPALQRLMKRGVHGRLKTLDPPLSPMLWSSIATGFRADKHGIKGFIEPLPDGSGLRPVTSTSRKVKAIWNILNQEGYKSNVVAWWPSNPAEPINGVMVSNLYQNFTKKYEEKNKMPPGTVHPQEMEEILEEFRIHPQELTYPMVHPFIPNIEHDQELRNDKRTKGVMKILAHAASVHGACTHLMENTEWDFMAVYHDAIDHFSHLTMKFHPPKRDHISEKDYENFNGVVEAGYRFHDMMLDRQLDLIDEDTTVILISDHGFHPDHQRPKAIPKEPSGPAIEHSPYGIFVAAGPGIKDTQEYISGAKVIDVTPTLLTLMGFPVGKDMEGRVLSQVFSEEVKPEFIDSWEDVPGDSGMHSSEQKQDPWAAQQAMQQLIDLGYIEKMDDDKMDKVEKAVRESDYYLARNLIDGGKYPEAIEILERIFEETGIGRYGQRLAYAYLSTQRYKKCKLLIDRLRVVEKENFEKEKEESAAKTKEKETKDPFANLEFEEPLYLDYLEGIFLLTRNQPNKAIPLLNKVLEKNPYNTNAAMSMGRLMNRRKEFDKAEKYFLTALSSDPRNFFAHHGLGVSFLRRGNYDMALIEFLEAIECNYFNFNAHYHLGETLTKKGLWKNAAEAFQVAVRLEPGLTKAHRWLEKIYTDEIPDPEKAQKHKNFIDQNIKAEVIVVSGLPRSGTSMMMQMLQAGGMEILTDEKREADDSNPKGYLEYAPVKRLMADKSWVSAAEGKAVKVVAPLIPHLPTEHIYRVIFMERDMDEVLISQQKMLGKPVAKNAIPSALYNAFHKHLEQVDAWVNAQPNVNILKIPYRDVIDNAEDSASIVANFLGKELDITAMAGVVDQTLYRNKQS